VTMVRARTTRIGGAGEANRVSRPSTSVESRGTADTDSGGLER
jgi:hypothetical protein